MKQSSIPLLLIIVFVALHGAISRGVPIEDAAKVPLPADFPELERKGRQLPNGSGDESKFTELYWVNSKLLRRLSEYTADSIAVVCGERMKKEQDVHVKLLLATLAARNGNEEARKFIEKMTETTDYAITLSRLSALHLLVTAANPREWVFDAVHQALGDTRHVTGLEKTKWSARTQLEISYLADEMESLTYALGAAKNPKSVPILIEMIRRNGGHRGAVTALGTIGDPRAIPLCLELLQREDEAIKKRTTNELAPTETLTRALGGLKAKEAVPTLLTYLFSKEAIAALGEIGDERAIEPLRQIVAANGRVDPDPYTWEKRFQERKFAARMALIKLEQEDPIPKWITVLNERSLEWAQRRLAVWELGWHPDPRAIAPLVALVKSDPDGEVVNQSITVLATFPYKTAVQGLIECFDADFTGKSDWIRAYTPAMFAENIGSALHALTGKDFGVDKVQWAKWWNEDGKNIERLK